MYVMWDDVRTNFESESLADKQKHNYWSQMKDVHLCID